ncbi:MAG: phosphatase PAP2 family protein [Bacteroidales bacterium]|nr:phosphatase PAP2 family protein [Clostridium sp.]MCM1204846.1 phosphatase PAP2 family protein [Bacteroidales bacterium]
MLTDWIVEVDFTILNWIQENIRCDILDKIFPALTSLGEKGWFFIAVAVILLCIPRYRKWGAALLCSLLLGLICGNLMIKNIVMRIRPYDHDLAEGVVLLVDKLKDYSFPSGHTMAVFEFFAVICAMPVKKGYKAAAGIFALLMAFSRLYLYVHFPSDVLMGMVLGTLFGMMGCSIITMLAGEREKSH